MDRVTDDELRLSEELKNLESVNRDLQVRVRLNETPSFVTVMPNLQTTIAFLLSTYGGIIIHQGYWFLGIIAVVMGMTWGLWPKNQNWCMSMKPW